MAKARLNRAIAIIDWNLYSMFLNENNDQDGLMVLWAEVQINQQARTIVMSFQDKDCWNQARVEVATPEETGGMAVAVLTIFTPSLAPARGIAHYRLMEFFQLLIYLGTFPSEPKTIGSIRSRRIRCLGP